MLLYVVFEHWNDNCITSIIFISHFLYQKKITRTRNARTQVRSLEQLSTWRERTFKERKEKRKQEDIIQGTIDRDEFGIDLESCTKEYVIGYENQIPSILVRLKEALELVGGTKKLGEGIRQLSAIFD